MQFPNVIPEPLALPTFCLNPTSDTWGWTMWWPEHQTSPLPITWQSICFQPPASSCLCLRIYGFNIWILEERNIKKNIRYQNMYFLVPNFIHMLLIARKPSSKKCPSALLPLPVVSKGWMTSPARNRTSGLNIQSPIFSGTSRVYIMPCDLQENITNP